MSETVPLPFETIGVIVSRDLIGDALMKLPFLRALRVVYPKAEIHWITAQGPTAFSGDLRVATRSLINQIHDQPQWLGTLTRPEPNVTAPHFDLLIDTRNRWRESLHARLVPHRLFLAMGMRYLFSEKRPPLLQPKPVHLCDRLLQMIEIVAGYRPSATGALPVQESLLQKAKILLPSGATYVGLAPGAGNPTKIWPRYKFEKIAALQAAKGRVPVFILGPQESMAYDTLAEAVPSAKFPLQDFSTWGSDQLTIDHTLAVASLLNVAVANDSGVGHMLAAVDCPLLSLFGPTSSKKLAPRVSYGQVIRAQDYGSTQMNAITWELVNETLEGLLQRSQGGSSTEIRQTRQP